MMYDVCCMFLTPFQAACDHHEYITLFKMDGLGLADHEQWGMCIKSTHLALDYSETLKTSRLNEKRVLQPRFESMQQPLQPQPRFRCRDLCTRNFCVIERNRWLSHNSTNVRVRQL